MQPSLVMQRCIFLHDVRPVRYKVESHTELLTC